MSNITKVTDVLSALMGRAVPKDKVSKIVGLYLDSQSVDTDGMTAEQKAGNFLGCLKTDVKNHCQSEAISAAQRTNSDVEQIARDDIDSDFA
ncbi:MAG: hypothetical protein COA71_14415 [SAR86 cluster bacterium]|uniref:Uncharacterized protein n=1 Tax=SAR86 cluster bacterium TaxID=2030880 RepID=A0A2A5C5P1_9GAMM|nr:MAG: hypothetical protein COA71_14415 [SAR86 cluster bacterium]